MKRTLLKRLLIVALAIIPMPIWAQNLAGNDGKGHEYVDLGLSSGTLWATCNIGASSPEEYGGYYAWGELEEKDAYSWSTYKFYENGSLTKYCSSDGLKELSVEDDVAYVLWGHNWRMPSKDQVEELIEECTSEWTTQDGVSGRLITGPNNNTIFLPAAGYRGAVDPGARGTRGDYSARTLVENDNYFGFGFEYSSSSMYLDYNNNRYDGRTIRPVYVPSPQTPNLWVVPMGKEQAWTAKYMYSPTQEGEEPQEQDGKKWYESDYDDSSWEEMTSQGICRGIGSEDSRYGISRYGDTEWQDEYGMYWFRTSFNLDVISENDNYFLQVFVDDWCKIFLNGEMIAEHQVDGVLRLDKAKLRAGTNDLAFFVTDDGGSIAMFDFGIFLSKDGFIYRPLSNNTLEVIGYDSEVLTGKEITIPDKIVFEGTEYEVTKIGDNCFRDAPFEKINLPQTLKTIGDFAFEGAAIKTLVLPEGFESFSYYSIFGNSELETIYFPSTLKDLFCIYPGCYAAKNGFFVSEDNPYFCAIDGILYNKDQSQLLRFPTGREGEFTVPEGVEVIGSGVFSHSNLTSIILPSSIREIVYYAFEHSKVKQLTISEGANPDIFGDALLSSVIESISLPSTLDHLDTYSFHGADNLTEINLNGNEHFVLEDGVLYDAEKTTMYWISKEYSGEYVVVNLPYHGSCLPPTVIVPGSFKSVPQQAFDSVERLQNVIFEEGVEEIGWFCFNGCGDLKCLTLPSTLKKINAGVVVNDCVVYCKAPTPPIFEDPGHATVYVPLGSKTLYLQDPAWSQCTIMEDVNLNSSFYAQTTVVNQGKQIVVPVYLPNNEPVCGFQFDLVLPEGMSLEEVKLGSERFEDLDHAISMQQQEDGSFRILCSSNSNNNIWNETLEGEDIRNTAPVLNLTINIASDMEPKSYCTTLKNIVTTGLVDGQTTEQHPADSYIGIEVTNLYMVNILSDSVMGSVEVNGDNYDADKKAAVVDTEVTLTANPEPNFGFVRWTENGEEISIENPLTITVNEERNIVAEFTLMGDVHENKLVNVADLTSTASIILNGGNTDDHRAFVAADVYTDEEIDVADYTEIVSIILNGGRSYSAKGEQNKAQNARLSLQGNLQAGEEGELMLMLDNVAAPIANMQFDLTLPEGISLASKAVELTDRGVGHSLSTRVQKDGSLRVLVTSLQNAPFEGTEGAVMVLHVKADKNLAQEEMDIQLSHITLAHGNLRYTQIPSMTSSFSVSPATGININKVETNDDIYNLSGQKFSTVQKGVNIVNGKKYVNK